MSEVCEEVAMNEFYVYDSVRDQWLQDDEQSLGSFETRCGFTDRTLASDIAKREARGRTGWIVLGYEPMKAAQ